MNTLVILPTYNEAGNITRLFKELKEKFSDIDILHIDDNSPDGTAEIALEYGLSNYRQIRNFRKMGLGSAYRQGFKWAIERNYKYVITMDSDGSHQIKDLERLLEVIDNYDLVIGTRWMPKGSVVNWPLYRQLISKFGTWYAKKALKLPYRDLTSGFRVYRCSMLKKLNLGKLDSKGYVFQIQMVEAIAKNSGRIKEVPITFVERIQGRSKMTGRIALEAFIWITKKALRLTK
mgnify:FL=1